MERRWEQVASFVSYANGIEPVRVKPTSAEALLKRVLGGFVLEISLLCETCAKNSRKYPCNGRYLKVLN
jgi:hypothetical protein